MFARSFNCAISITAVFNGVLEYSSKHKAIITVENSVLRCLALSLLGTDTTLRPIGRCTFLKRSGSISNCSLLNGLFLSNEAKSSDPSRQVGTE